MKSLYDEWSMWQQLMTMLENQFGNRCEIILHDLTKDYNHTIVDIRNGHLTNRKIGDCGSNLGLEVLRGTVQDGDRYNYVVNTRDGKLLRSSTMFIKNDEGAIIGSLCLNTDITETVRFEEYLKQYNQFNLYPDAGPLSVGPGQPDSQEQKPLPPSGSGDCGSAPSQTPSTFEIFANDVSEVLDFLIAEANKLIGKPVSQMKREDKIEFVRYLDKKGAFLITHSAERVYEYLNISRFTLYNYLDIVRKENDGKASQEQGEVQN